MRSNEDKEKFLKILEQVPFISHASKKAGIDKATIYRWRKKDKRFNSEVEEALDIGRSGLCDVAESQLVKKINQGEFRAIKFFIENNDKRYIKPRPINIFQGKPVKKESLSKKDMKKLDDLLFPS